MRRGLILAVLVVACAAATPGLVHAASRPAQRWIVLLEPGARVADVAASVRGRFGISPGQRFGHVLNGFAMTMTPAQRDVLAADARVRAIVADLPIAAAADPYPETGDEVQPGLSRVGALHNPLRAASGAVDIAVLDTGIQVDNPDLNVVGGYNCTDPANPNGGYGDAAFFGHGTHVAGIAAARHDGRGVSGVAAGARLWAIKVLQNNGNGYWSWVICGLERVAAMRDGDGTPTIEVVNLSLAAPGTDDGDCGHANGDLLHQAVCRVAETGITMVAAAGNEKRDAAGYVPGAYDEVITVSAMADWNGRADGVPSPPPSGEPSEDCPRDYGDDTFAGFSNFGADVDLIAPGTCVVSTLPVTRLGLMTGTSMATPHVAGAAALYFLSEAAAGRPRPSPEQVRAALVARGTLDWKTSTDPDRGRAGSAREPALFAADFDVAPGLEIGTRRQVVRAQAGSPVANAAWVARIGGFDEAVDLQVDARSLPAGASASIDGRNVAVQLAAATPAGSYNVRIVGSGGGQTDSVTFRLVVFRGGSDPGAPTLSLPAGVTAGALTLPVRVSWPAVFNAQRYALARSVDAGAWTTIAHTTRRALTVSATPGMRYQFRVRALVGGTWREWRTGASAVVQAFDPGTAVVLAGPWHRASIDDTVSELPVYAEQGGATATLTFSGRSVAWIGSRGPSRGRATVSVDGSMVATVDLYADSRRNRVLLFSRSWSSSGTHTLRITVSGAPQARPRVDLDAFVTVGD